MSKVRTVLGDIDSSDLGVTDAHEHLFIVGGMAVFREPDFRLDSVEAARAEVGSFMQSGGRAIVDTMPLGCGRSAEKLVEVARATGANIVATTGFHKEYYYDSLHWIHRYSAEQISRLLIDEVSEGMDEYGHNGPFPRRIESRAGAIKVASDYQKISKITEKLFEAAAIAHRATGAPVLTHCEHGTMAVEQVERLTGLGISPEHLIIGHLDRNADLAYHRQVASSGVFVEYDGAGRIKYQPECETIALVEGMIEAGHASQILLGGDMARRSYWRSYGGGPGIAYLLDRFVPRLRDSGVDEPAIEAMLITNPARALSLAERTPGGKV